MTYIVQGRKTITGIIRSRLASYQARRLAGELQKTFAEELTAEGYPTNHKDFRTLYARAKKQLKALEGSEHKKILVQGKMSAAPTAAAESDALPPGDGDISVSHRPSDLDAIIHHTPNLAALAKLSKKPECGSLSIGWSHSTATCSAVREGAAAALFRFAVGTSACDRGYVKTRV